MLACMGSHDQTTFRSALLIFSKIKGSNLSMSFEPILTIKTIFPFSFLGFKVLITFKSSFLSVEGPTLIPIGLLIPLQNST